VNVPGRLCNFVFRLGIGLSNFVITSTKTFPFLNLGNRK
jgi:hypothetical protein